MKYRVLAFATLFAILGTSTTFATPVTVNPDENVFFNFDLTGLSPGPVYDEIVIYTNITNIDGDELGTWNFYDEFGPPPGTFVGGGALLSDPLVFSAAGVNDGIFSLQLVLFNTSGSSLTVDPYAVGVIHVPGAPDITTDRTPPVPLPGALVLMATGLGMLGTMVKRRKA
jgi:hypothetical protein